MCNQNQSNSKSSFNPADVYIDRVITVRLDPDDMEQVNISTGISPFSTDNWCNFSEFEYIEESINSGDNTKTNLKKYVSEAQYDALKNGLADYIVFRFND